MRYARSFMSLGQRHSRLTRYRQGNRDFLRVEPERAEVRGDAQYCVRYLRRAG